MFGLSPTALLHWVYGLLIAGLLLSASVAWHNHNVTEQKLGQQQVLAQNAALAAATTVHDKEVTDRAQKLVDAALAEYKATVAAPSPPAPSIVCRRAAPAPISAAVPGNGSAASGGNGGTHIPDESDVPFDPAPAVIADGRDADAQVTLLQKYILACQAAGRCAK